MTGAIASYLILAIVLAGVIAIAWIAMRAMGVSPPAWATQIIWIVVIVVVAVLAIRFLMGV